MDIEYNLTAKRLKITRILASYLEDDSATLIPKPIKTTPMNFSA
jgi:hypothetical protein